MEEVEVIRMEKRLQMLVALVFFTPTVLASLGSDTLRQKENVLAWCAIVAVYIIIYLAIEASKGKINKFKGTILDYGIWVNLIAFIPYFLILAIYKPDEVISGFPLLALFITVITVFWSPLVVVLMLAFEFALNEFFSFVDTIKNKI
jgi:hypothetical protein